MAGSSVGGSGRRCRGWNPQRAEDFFGRRQHTPNRQHARRRCGRTSASLGVPAAAGEGGVHVVAVGGPELVGLFALRALDGAWCPSRSSAATGYGRGRVDAPRRRLTDCLRCRTANLLARAPELVERWLQVHLALCALLNKGDDEAVALYRRNLFGGLATGRLGGGSGSPVAPAFRMGHRGAGIQALADKAYAVGLIQVHRRTFPASSTAAAGSALWSCGMPEKGRWELKTSLGPPEETVLGRPQRLPALSVRRVTGVLRPRPAPARAR